MVVLDSNHPFIEFQFDNPVHEQEGVSVRQNADDILVVEREVHNLTPLFWI